MNDPIIDMSPAQKRMRMEKLQAELLALVSEAVPAKPAEKPAAPDFWRAKLAKEAVEYYD
jgi:hypothetical protein